MNDEDLRRLLDAHATRIEKAFESRLAGIEAAIVALDRKIDEKTNGVESRMDLAFADTQAMIKFSHAELDRRIKYMEQTLQTLEDRFAGLQTRVDRLEETARTEN
jgi:hypothetical protein